MTIMTKQEMSTAYGVTSGQAEKVTVVGFVLLPEYTMISFTNAVEVLRMANYISQKTLYRWRVVTVGGMSVKASNGLEVKVSDEKALDDCDMVFICGGMQIYQAANHHVHNLIKRLAQKQVPLGGLCTGAFVLANAGMLNGYRCAIHWENLSVATELFPRVIFTHNIFVIDRDRYTCSGGTASLDMTLHLVGRFHGKQLAAAISEQFILERQRGLTEVQHIPRPECIGPGYEHVSEAIELMQANIEEVLSLVEIARLVKVSQRQMERLFNRYYDMSPAQYYLRLRLRRARELLEQTSMPIMHVTVSCGFMTSSHFCKTFRRFFGYSPSEQRKHGEKELAMESNDFQFIV